MYYVKARSYNYNTDKWEYTTIPCKNLDIARETAIEALKHEDAEYIHIYTKSNGRLKMHSLIMWVGKQGSYKWSKVIPDGISSNCTHIYRINGKECFVTKDGRLSGKSWKSRGIY